VVEDKILSKTLKEAITTGKCIFGSRGVISSIKGSKLVVYSSSLKSPLLDELIKKCDDSSIPILSFKGSSINLGRICGKDFRVSTMLVRLPGDANLRDILDKEIEE
tara:strand:+ start:352 stop:669 length:318 start_codon:yes stop_codon:yes gene_type:complete